MKTILITGASGLIGSHLKDLLQSKGYTTISLSRKKSVDESVYFWNISENYIDPIAIKKADFIIHLAGAGIADERWTKNRKKILLESRVKTTQLLFDKINEYNPSIEGLIAASGIGYYGTITCDEIFTEESPCGKDFLAEICAQWEMESLKFQKEQIRTVIFRTGIVLTSHGGALAKISWPIRHGIGAFLGKGIQYMPWIHIDDLCRLYLFAIENKKIKGIFNAIAPNHITNKEFTTTLAKKLDRKIWLPPVPSWLLKLFYGEMSDILLKGSRISEQKISNTGFEFNYKELMNALVSLDMK